AWKDFLVRLKGRGLKGVELVVSDAWHTFTRFFRSLDGVGGTKVDPTGVMNYGMC
ncbi:transposase, partial [Sinorhizobium meliloti]|uniref:transposase n=1 Tax=Rhizobium meliloti TaxID=382 RepID=UPI0035AC074D